ncbi:hypothetical protein HELRODRAFT_115201 [Helobdella robusta]|uniref:MI domain-containing protein n=1 Tax=Helobdella robusta TaxID=6412 RepID=T1EG72_HELRO|nr:hypothetical protein HELRODRAFT_115201 [Helobdella robusta]ESN94139.1 hypothetical protein HELRODRAFT_115201 [Helobdella robusta]
MIKSDHRRHRDRGERDRDRGERDRDRGKRDRDRGERDRDRDERDINRAPVTNKRPRTDDGEDNFMTKTGGAYIPPAKLKMMQAQITDKSSAQYQRIAWEALKKSIHGLINKVTAANIIEISEELFQENIVRGRGLLVRSLMQAQSSSLMFTHVYAALVAIVNTKFPQIGELLMKRLIAQFRRGFRRNNKTICLACVRFLAHLVNQQVAHEIIALELVTLLLEKPTDDSVEVAVGFLKECGQKLIKLSPKGSQAVFDRLRTILNEASIDLRVLYMIEVMFAIRKDGFKDHPSVISDLDLIQEDDQFTHMLTLEDDVDQEEHLNIFRFDPDYEENEQKYQEIKKELLGEGSNAGEDDEDDDDEEEEEGGGDDEEDGEKNEEKQLILDNTETNLVSLRRTIYLTIQSSLDFEECAHKLLKIQWKPGQETELCNMIMDCCAQQRTYEKFYGLLAQRFCMIDRKYVEPNQTIFKEQYDTIHRLETNKLRNVAKFFAHLLHTDAISWEVLSSIKLNEDDTTSSSRIFIKILFQELAEYMGLTKLNNRLKDSTLQPYFEGIFPRDSPRNTRFSINFFTSIGLGGLTDDLRNHLKAVTAANQKAATNQRVRKTSSSSSSSSSSDDD